MDKHFINKHQTPKDQQTWEKERVWNALLHEDKVLNWRLNVFLLFQAILFSTFVRFRSETSDSFLLAITLLCILTTLIWWYILERHQYILESLRNDCEEMIVEYRKFRGNTKPSLFKTGTTVLLARWFPIVISTFWVLFILMIFLDV